MEVLGIKKLQDILTGAKWSDRLVRNLYFLCFFLFICLGFSLLLSPYLYSAVAIPYITTPSERVNSDVVFRATEPFITEINDGTTLKSEENQGVYEVGIDLASGVYDYELFGYQENRLFTNRSKESVVGQVIVDTEEPVISNNSIEPVYHEPETSLAFVSNEPVTIVKDKEQKLECSEEIIYTNEINSSREYEYTCPLVFKSEGEKDININFIDTAGNYISTEQKTLYTPFPELNCNDLQAITNERSTEITCTPNKEGFVYINNKEYDINARSANIFPLELEAEGENSFEIVFKDTYDFEQSENISIIRDTEGPAAEFTFLDTKKEFLNGNITLGLKPSENGFIEVNFYPINNFFETDELARQILDSGNFVYEGGQRFEQDVIAGEEVTFTTSNNFALCQMLSETNKNCFSPGVVGIDITLTDSLGNSRNYLCNNWLTTTTAPLDGLEATTCQEK